MVKPLLDERVRDNIVIHGQVSKSIKVTKEFLFYNFTKKKFKLHFDVKLSLFELMPH